MFRCFLKPRQRLPSHLFERPSQGQDLSLAGPYRRDLDILPISLMKVLVPRLCLVSSGDILECRLRDPRGSSGRIL